MAYAGATPTLGHSSRQRPVHRSRSSKQFVPTRHDTASFEDNAYSDGDLEGEMEGRRRAEVHDDRVSEAGSTTSLTTADLLLDITLLAAKGFVRQSASLPPLQATPILPSAIVVELLQSFCSLLVARAASNDQFEVCRLVKREARGIACAIRKILRRSWHMSEDTQSWLWCLSTDYGIRSRCQKYFEHARTGTVFPHRFVAVYTFVSSGEEFDWLVHSLCVTATTTQTGSGRAEVSRVLLDHICNSTKSHIELQLDWRPDQFLAKQYPSHQDRAVADCIAYCGYEDVVEAVTCEIYVARLWRDDGLQVLKALDATLASSTNRPSAEEVYDKSKSNNIRVEICDNNMSATISGSLTFRLGAAETLVWLGTACRASSHESRTAYCTALLAPSEDKHLLMVEYSSELVQGRGPQPSGGDHIAGTSDDELALTDCWLSLVRNPVVVLGYPVSRRYSDERGLEITLAMVASLIQAKYATVFHHVTVINGIYSMLVATFEEAGSVYWHFLPGDLERPVSYAEAPSCTDEDTTGVIKSLWASRHFVGWSRRTQNMIGTKNCNYSVNQSMTKAPWAGFAFDGLTLGFSNVGVGSVKVVPGVKDSELAFDNLLNAYESRLNRAAQLRIVLYDVPTKRAWLIDGIEAILYLSLSHLSSLALKRRASARRMNTRCLTDDFLFRDAGKAGMDTARDTLEYHRNRAIRLGEREQQVQMPEATNSNAHSKSDTYETLVEQFHEALCKAEGHFRRRREKERWNVKGVLELARCTMLGFDFTDLVELGREPKPKAVALQRMAESWLAMTKDMDTINLFGSGFGELITATSRNACPSYTPLPPKLDLLAAPVDLLYLAAKALNNANSNSLRLSETLSWNSPLEAFTLPCGSGGFQAVGHIGLCLSHLVELDEWYSRQLSGNTNRTFETFFDSNPSAAIVLGSKQSIRRSRSSPQVKNDTTSEKSSFAELKRRKSSLASTDTASKARSPSPSLNTSDDSTLYSSEERVSRSEGQRRRKKTPRMYDHRYDRRPSAAPTSRRAAASPPRYQGSSSANVRYEQREDTRASDRRNAGAARMRPRNQPEQQSADDSSISTDTSTLQRSRRRYHHDTSNERPASLMGRVKKRFWPAKPKRRVRRVEVDIFERRGCYSSESDDSSVSR